MRMVTSFAFRAGLARTTATAMFCQCPVRSPVDGRARIDQNPGGTVSDIVGGFVGGDRFAQQGLAAAQAIFDAMIRAKESGIVESGITTVRRKSAGGPFACESRSLGSAIQDGVLHLRPAGAHESRPGEVDAGARATRLTFFISVQRSFTNERSLALDAPRERRATSRKSIRVRATPAK